MKVSPLLTLRGTPCPRLVLAHRILNSFIHAPFTQQMSIECLRALGPESTLVNVTIRKQPPSCLLSPGETGT